jgi:hypothetical protein
MMDPGLLNRNGYSERKEVLGYGPWPILLLLYMLFGSLSVVLSIARHYQGMDPLTLDYSLAMVGPTKGTITNGRGLSLNIPAGKEQVGAVLSGLRASRLPSRHRKAASGEGGMFLKTEGKL